MTDREILEAQIKAIRAHHYAISYGERNPGVVCVSVPLYHYAFPAAVSVIGPEIRLEPSIKTVIDEMKQSGRTISERLHEFAEKGTSVK